MSNIYTSSASSAVLGDLYALQQLIYESRIGSSRFYLKLEEGSFQRPCFYIKLIESSMVPRVKEFRGISSQVMVQYFTDDFYDAHVVATQLQMLLSGAPVGNDVILPRYDFSTNPPIKRSVSGWDGDNTFVGGGTMGARIDPSTISNGGILQEDNREWNAPITFTMYSPMPTWQDYPVIEDVIFDFLTGTPVLAQILSTCARGVPSVELSIE
jgi:hypothetical protein